MPRLRKLRKLRFSYVGGPWIIRHVTDNWLVDPPGEWWDIGPLRFWVER